MGIQSLHIQMVPYPKADLPVNCSLQTHIQFGQQISWHFDKRIFSQSHLSSVQNPSVIPLNPGWLIGIPRSWIIMIFIIFNTLGSIIPYKYHNQPTGVLQSLLISSYVPPLVFRISSPCCPSNNHHLGCAASGTFTSKGGASTHCCKSYRCAKATKGMSGAKKELLSASHHFVYHQILHYRYSSIH